MKKQKLSLNDLKVDSFVTSSEMQKTKGGTIITITVVVIESARGNCSTDPECVYSDKSACCEIPISA